MENSNNTTRTEGTDDYINTFYSMDFNTYELRKIAKAVVEETLSKTRGEERQAIINDIKKIVRQYNINRGSH